MGLVRSIVASSLLISAVITAQASETYVSLGYGGVSCEAWAQRNAIENRAYEAWILGFISSYNAYVFKGPNVVATTDNEGLRNWIDNYCKHNPKDNLDTATQALIEDYKKATEN